MSDEIDRKRSPVAWIIAAALLVGAGGGLWLANQRGEAPASREPATEATAVDEASESSTPGGAVRVAAPTVVIAESGRLSVELSELRDGDVMAIGLAMPDEARGEEPRPVRVIDAEGRAIDAVAVPIDGAGTGARLEIDPEWLRPGHYMIQVKTAEKHPLALRRYVLELTVNGQVSE
jgi:hypothetical protein